MSHNNIVELEQIQYRVQGHIFTLLPSSSNNRKLAGEKLALVKQGTDDHIKALQHNRKSKLLLEEREALLEAGEEPDDLEIPELIHVSDFEPYDVLFGLFCAITTGPHDKLVPGDFDTRYARRARADFLDEAYSTTDLQASFFDL